MKKVKNKKSKKRKSKKSNMKSVHEFIHFKATGNENGYVNIRIGKNGEINCAEAEDGTLSHYKGYMRDSGKEKRIVRSFSRSGTAYPTQRDNIVINYDMLAGIDTNDFMLGERKLSIAVSYFAKSIHSQNVAFEPVPSFVISDVDKDVNSEVVAWYLFMKHILPILNMQENKTLGLVVDSELGRHPAINRREEPYYIDNYLPQNVFLLYASSDTGTDLPNKLIKLCDTGSRKLFGMIQRGEIALPAQLGAGCDVYSGYAYVNHLESQFTE